MQNFGQNNYEDQNMMGANSMKKKGTEAQSINIVPGYKNFVLDENNAAYDSIADMFTKEEIEQAFKIIDYRNTGQITSEQLTFFLESIGEQAKPEEIEEMIKMCDQEGFGYVTKDEFFKLASGQSLAPIGQAFPPTEEMLKKKELIENLNLEEYQNQKNKMMSMNMQNAQGNKAKKNNQQSTLNFTQINDQTTLGQSKIDTTKLGMKNVNAEIEQNQKLKTSNLNATTNLALNTTSALNKTNVQSNTSYSQQLQPKKDLQNKLKVFTKWQKDNKINPEKLLQYTKQINEIQKTYQDEDEIEDYFVKEYREFLKFLGLTDSAQNQEIFKLAQTIIPDASPQKISIYLFLFLLITSQDINSSGKYGLAFQMIGKEIITFEDLILIEKRLTLSENVSEDKIRTKFVNHKNKKEYKSKTYGTEEMDRPFFLDLVTSYPTCFQV
ncbi:hypothetical protein ABPG74_022442 [Tetrahymena malaccensis]